MDASPQEQAKSLILANLAKKGYRGKLPFDFSVAEKEFDDASKTSVFIHLPPLCDSSIVPFLARQLGIATGHNHSSLTSFHNGDGGLSIWHDSGNTYLQIAREGKLSEKDMGIVAELYHACNDFATQRKKRER